MSDATTAREALGYKQLITRLDRASASDIDARHANPHHAPPRAPSGSMHQPALIPTHGPRA